MANFDQMSDAELEALIRQKEARVAALSQPQRPAESSGALQTVDNFVRKAASGATFGLADEAAALAGTVTGLGGTGFYESDKSFGETYDANLAKQRGIDKQIDKTQPGVALAGELAGGMLTGVPGASKVLASKALQNVPTIAKMAGAGAVAGGASGFGNAEGGVGNRLKGAGEGAAIGGATGAATAGLLAGGQRALSSVVSRMGQPEDAAQRKLLQTLTRDAPEAAQGDPLTWARTRLGKLGPEATLADLGENTRDLTRTVASYPGKPKQMANRVLNQRQNAQADRLVGDVQAGLGTDGRFHQTFDDMSRKQQEAAAPLYDKAFSGGSTAPLSVQAQEEFAAALNARAAAEKALREAQNDITLSRAKTAQTENVYVNNRALSAERDATARLTAAQKAMNDAEGARTTALEKLRRAQADDAAGVRGGVWDERVQQFLDDPIIQQGIRQGLEVQRLEALAAGKKFDPTEYAVKGFADNGDPIVGSVPNMRLLDAAKRGLDNILEGYRDTTTGKLVLDQRGRAIDGVRKSLLDKLDELNPDYKAARAAWAGPAQSKDAMSMGRRFMRGDDELTGDQIAKLSDGDKQFFRVGVTKEIRDMLVNQRDGVDKVKKLFGTPAMRNRLEAVFPDKRSFFEFQMAMLREAEMAKTKDVVLGGPSTARILASQQDAGMDVAGPVISATQGRGRDALGSLARNVKGALTAMPEGVRKDVGQKLLTTDKATQQAILDDLLRRYSLRNIPGAVQQRIGAAAANELGGAASTP